jgi:hypothetical protein
MQRIWSGEVAFAGLNLKTRAYAKRRTTEGKTKKEIKRCLKRYIAREVYTSLDADLRSLSPS